MANQMEELGIVIKADGTVELANGMKLSAEQISGVGKKLDELGQKLSQTEKGQKAVAGATKEMGKELATSREHAVELGKDLANGRWRQVAGDIAQMAIESRVLSGSMLGAGLAVGTVLAGLGAVALAAYEGAKAEHALNEKLTLTGNFAGLVTGQLDAMAGSIARNIGGTVGNAREVLAGLVSTGRFTAQSLTAAATAAQLLQRYTGETSQQVVKHFEGMSGGVARWAQKANDSYHFLSLAQWRHIQQLEEQGRKQDAMRVTSEALSRHLGGDLTQNLGLLQRAWMGVATWASKAWDTMMGLGRQESTQEKIDTLTARINVIANSRKGRYTQEQKDALIAGLQGERSALQSDALQERRLAEMRSARQQAEEAAIAAAAKKTRTGKTPAQRLEEQMRDELERLSFDRDNALDLMNMSPERRAFMDVQRRLETQYQGGPQALKDQILAAARARMEQQQSYQSALTGARERQTSRNDEYTNADRSVNDAIAQRTQAAHEGTVQLRQDTQRLNIDLIRDDQARARRQLEVEVEAWRQRISVQREGSLERETLENAFAEWMVARQAQLNQQLQPGWQRMMEGWGDSMKMVRDAHDNAMQGVVQSGEDFFVQWARTGKLNARGMVDSILVEFARLQYRQNIAGPLAGFANNFISNLFGTNYGGAGITGGGGFGTGKIFGNQDYGQFFHAGGMVGGRPTFSRNVNPAVFANAPRFHTGGIAGDEVPIIAKRGEGVFTKEQMANLQPAGATTTVTYAPQISIDARTDQAQVYDLVSRAVIAGQADLLDKLNRGMVD